MKPSHNIEKLYEISKKPERRIIGLMSGTSLDGLDVALCSFKGSGCETDAKVLNFLTIDYSEEEKSRIRRVFGKNQIDLQELCVLNPWIGNLHGEMVLQCLQIWGLQPSDVDIIASHGQTIFHAPKSFHNLDAYGNSTLQIGDGDHVAMKTGIITVSDFRQKHIAAGGEGAPLVVYGDYLLFSKAGEDRIMLNIGGIANFTYLPGNNVSAIISTDTGPGNTLLDSFAREMFGKSFDKDGDFARSGRVNSNLLQDLKIHGFFTKNVPKSTGPELFSTEYVKTALKKMNEENISPFDLMATLTRFSAETIAETVKHTVKLDNTNGDEGRIENQLNNQRNSIFISGGGSHNIFLIEQLQELLPEFELKKIDTLGISGDAKEAVLFATLANECLCGQTDYTSAEEKGLLNISMGKISFPN